MSRLDWKHGRFTADYETNEINKALPGVQHNFGDWIDYYRFDHENSQMDAIYDEGAGVGRVFDVTLQLPVLHATHEEGGAQDTDTGFYWNDDLHVVAIFHQWAATGMSLMDIQTQNYTRDRIVYDNKVFRVTKIDVLGQVRRRDIIVGVEATGLRNDELVNDEQFAQWAITPSP